MREHDLILLFNGGNEKAFKIVFEMYYKRLMYLALRLIHNKTEAEDIILPVFQSLFTRCAKFATIAKIQAFLFISVRNRCLNHIQLNDRTNARKSKFIDQLQSETDFDWGDSIRDEIMGAIYRLIEELPGECKRIFKMLYFDELTPTEVSKRLNIETQTIYAQKHRALNYLKQKLS
jgi:RNA polymerase sigma-70 factor (family 1)